MVAMFLVGSCFVVDLTNIISTNLQIIRPCTFRDDFFFFFKDLTNQKQEFPRAALFLAASRQNEEFL